MEQRNEKEKPQGEEGHPLVPPQHQQAPLAPNFPPNYVEAVTPPPAHGYPAQNYLPAQPYYPPNPHPQPYGGVPVPVVTQPGAGGYGPPGGWMNMPQGVPNCPPGLEYLASIDQLLAKQKVEVMEAFTGFETNNKFTVLNSLGQNVYYAVEKNDCCTRNCCGASRPFDMKIMDNYRQEIIHLYRPLRCASCWCPCCLQTMEVSSPPGNVIGSVEQNWSLCHPSFDLKDQSGQTILKIKGPFCQYGFCGEVEFQVKTLDGEQVGEINKQFSGFAREVFTDADNFGITFPMNLDVKMKAVLLGACFLIDMMYFEKSGNQKQKNLHRPGEMY